MDLSIKAHIYELLTSLGITSNVYYGNLPQNPSYPATVYDVVSQPPVALTHDVGVVGFRQARLQIDVFALGVEEVETAMEAYYELLKSYSGVVGDGQSPETFVDVDIWDEGANPDLEYEGEPTLRNVEARSRDFMVQY